MLEWTARRLSLDIPPDEETGTQCGETELARAVMRYLVEHPQAMDSLEGIAEWWVPRQHVQVDLEALVRTLGRLSDEGRIEKVDSVRGPLYRLKR